LPTFLFTDIQGSTKKWQLFGDAMNEALKKHDHLIRDTVRQWGGRIVKHTGDGFMAVFENGSALECALAIQKGIGSHEWKEVEGLSVRIGISSGQASEQHGDFFGSTVNRAARLVAVAWGGQIVLDGGVKGGERVPEGARLVDQGIHMLRDLLRPQQIYTLEHSEIDRTHPPLATVSCRPHNLPVQPTPFVGRARELKEIIGMLEDPGKRLVTLLGYGGSGKTRTALQAAAESMDLFRHGVWFVPLEEVQGPSAFVSRIAESLSLSFSGGRKETDILREFLSKREILLILDNFEHLTELSHMVSDLLSYGKGVKSLVTSRHRLGIREENIFDLTGLSLPPPHDDHHSEDYDSTSLFLSLARRIRSDFFPDKEGMKTINAICKAVDGLPLAIELAVSWVRTISCSDLERELRRSMEILESSAGDLPARQKSMLSAFQYSWSLLGPEERTSLARLSVFEGGFGSGAAEEVADCGLRLLRSLCDHSLVRSDGSRYHIHPLVKEFAAEKLRSCEKGSGETPRRHCSYFHGYMESVNERMQSGNQRQALESISAELPNLRRGTIEAAGSGRFEILRSYTSGLSHFLQIRSRFSEGIEFFNELRDIVMESQPISEEDALQQREISARLGERTATFLMMAGRRKEAGRELNEAVRLAEGTDDPSFTALCHAGLGNIAYMSDDWEGAEEYWTRAADLMRQVGQERSLSSLLCNLANVSKIRGNYSRARSILEEVRRINSDSEDIYLNASIYSTMGDIARREGDAASAESYFLQSLELNRKIGNSRGASYCLESIAGIILERDPESSLEYAEQALQMALESGSLSRKIRAMLSLAGILAENGLFERALEQVELTRPEILKLDDEKLRMKVEETRSGILSMCDGKQEHQ
jgi:predicted ATPase/class 3 adenylate cyclase